MQLSGIYRVAGGRFTLPLGRQGSRNAGDRRLTGIYIGALRMNLNKSLSGKLQDTCS